MPQTAPQERSFHALQPHERSEGTPVAAAAHPRAEHATVEAPVPFKLRLPGDPEFQRFPAGVNPALPDEWTDEQSPVAPPDGPLTPELDPFDRVFQEIIFVEGGYADHPSDRGGRTMYGLSEKYHPDLWDEGRIPTMGDAHTVYRREYWDRIRGDDLASIDPGLAHAVMDAAVHHGPRRAVELLQGAVGLREDGLVGPVTLNALFEDPKGARRALDEARLAYFDRIISSDPTQEAFRAGWRARVDRIEALYGQGD